MVGYIFRGESVRDMDCGVEIRLRIGSHHPLEERGGEPVGIVVAFSSALTFARSLVSQAETAFLAASPSIPLAPANLAVSAARYSNSVFPSRSGWRLALFVPVSP